MNRRQVLLGGAAVATFAVCNAVLWRVDEPDEAQADAFEVRKTDDEWRKILSPQQFAVLRKQDTERPGTSPLDHETRKGVYHCAGCDLAAYSSETKYNSGTGWPSFWQSLPDTIGTRKDTSLFMARTEVHCRRCGGHFGHIFDDGPPPTGKRHCLNGLALKFVPATA